MVIQFLLIAALAVTMAYALRQKRRAPLVGFVVLLVGGLGIVFVLMPELATSIAQAMGVGRGADLLLYGFIVIGMLTVLNLHLRLLQSQDMLTAVARDVALFKVRIEEAGHLHHDLAGLGDGQPVVTSELDAGMDKGH